MNQIPLPPERLCYYYGHDFLDITRQNIGEQWFFGLGMLMVYRNICLRCDRWFQLNADDDVVEWRD